ncbi:MULTISPECIES: hypothetical protein [Pseudomonas]|jgi:hypothetical protein|uniref:Uncharacterized protein n=1 Tax=Pseudomonas sp. 11BF10 TaxID=941394 RepID=E7DYM5_9PSED|nr:MULTISPECIES: hypothetical protein [Pseudomonas]ADU55734.1 hypothetical protein orf10 [Pseudomonas sp. 11BF10]KMN00011.1 hypothetical protein TU84_22800 [Pseudomonas helleri]MBJ2182651.1 hypothetical protein [Pseudomonas veronii]MDB1111860.1 hypothetical protein [Pseudomonas extremaustralis]NNA01063.1 hypothetical protein [Pseudomonas lundensis]
MNSAPKFYLLYIDGVANEPIKLWSIGEVGPYISQHFEQALSSQRLELVTEAGEPVLDKAHLRRSAYFAKFGKWQILLFALFALVMILRMSNLWFRWLGGISFVGVIVFQLVPGWPLFLTRLRQRSHSTKDQ